MKKLVCIVLSVCVVILFPISVMAEDIEASAAAYVLYCPDNTEVLLSQNAYLELPMASTTKIMTTLITLEEAAVDNRTVTFTDEMTAEGSSMYLKKGEKVTLYDLAVGMMMQSGNDAANAAAISISGSIEAFAELMNAKAQAFGMSHTHFVTPSGLDDEAHYSTAYDMALLMARAMENEDFAYITAQTSMEVRFIYPADKFITYPNHNKLLRMYDSCIGGKTGYTDTAGRCLVSAAKQDGLTLIAVTLDDRHDWNDHISLYDHGFENYKAVTLGEDEAYTVDLVGGDSDTASVTAECTVVVLPKESDGIKKKVYLPAFLYAPVKAGESVGKLAYYADGEKLAETPLRITDSVSYNQQKRSLLTYIKDLLHWHS